MKKYKLTSEGSHNARVLAIDNIETPRNKLVYVEEVPATYTIKENEKKYESEGILQPVAMQDSVLYVCGVRGSGKSYFVSEYARNYNKKTGNRVILISVIKEDESMKLPERSVQFHPSDVCEAMKSGENLRELCENSMLIFDDVFDGEINNKNMKEQRTLMHMFIRDIIENGRHNNINICITSHKFANGHETQDILNDATGFVIMMDSLNMHGVNYMFDKYVGIKPKTIKTIINQCDNSRWLYYNRKSPNYIMTQQFIRLYDPKKEYYN